MNAVVVGAGAGGGVVAKELSEAGLSVVLLERGDWVSFETHGQDELINQRTTVLGNAYGPDDRSPRVVETAPGKWAVVMPNEGGYGNNAACVGSGTVSYGAMAWRYMERDFRMRSTYGAPEGSTLEDWPISYDDLEPFYEKAEWEIGVSGDMSANPFAPPRRRPYPMPAFPYNREGLILEAAAKRLGLHPFPIPMLRNSVPLRRPQRLRPQPLLLRLRLPEQRQERHPEHGRSRGRWPPATASCAPTRSPARSWSTTAAAPAA